MNDHGSGIIHPGPEVEGKRIRKRLFRRLFERRICGYVGKNGRECLATPTTPGGRCIDHGGNLVEVNERRKIKRQSDAENPGAVLMRSLQACMSDEDADRLEDIYRHGPCSLEDMIALVRVRIQDLERNYNEGFFTLDDYGRRLRELTEQLRKLTESNSKIQLNEALANRFTAPEEEAFNPFDHLPAPDKTEGGRRGE